MIRPLAINELFIIDFGLKFVYSIPMELNR